MNIEAYRAKIKQLSITLGLPINEFFDFEFSPFKSEFLGIFTFYTETLRDNHYYGIEPAFLYFNNYKSVNAKAGYFNGNYVITINMGTVFWLISNFKRNELLKKSSGSIRLFKILEPKLDTSINMLMYQTGCHFTFYHEMAHLIQNSNLLEFHLEEKPNNKEEFSTEKHLLECDADEFSSLCIASHILQYSEKIFDTNLNQYVLEGIIALISVPVILYLMSFESNNNSIYFEENTHPHPVIRLTRIVLTIVNYCNQSLIIENKSYKINQFHIINIALDIAEQLKFAFSNINGVPEYRKMISANRKEIAAYLKKIDRLQNGNDSLAVSKWNLLR